MISFIKGSFWCLSGISAEKVDGHSCAQLICTPISMWNRHQRKKIICVAPHWRKNVLYIILYYIVLLYHCHRSLLKHTRAILWASRLTHSLTHAVQTIGDGGVPGRAWKVNFSHLDKACQQSISKSTNSFRSICSLATHKGHWRSAG